MYKKLVVFSLVLLVIGPLTPKKGFCQRAVDSLIRDWKNMDEGVSVTDQVALLQKIGVAYKYSRPDSAIYYYQMAADMAAVSQLWKEEADLLSQIGGARYIQGEFDFALEYFSKALIKHQEINNLHGVAVGYNNLGIINLVQDNFKKSLDFHYKSVAICRDIHDSALLVKNFSNMGIVFRTMNENDSAIQYVNRALNLCKKIDAKDQFPLLYNLKGDVLCQMEELVEATHMYKLVLDSLEVDNKWEDCYAYAGLSKLMQKRGLLDESISYGLESYRMAKEIKAKWDLQNITTILSETYALKQDYEKAYQFQRLCKIYGDSIFNAEKAKSLNYFHLKQQEAENEMLAGDLEIQHQKIANKNLLIVLFGLALGFLAIIIFLQYRKNILKTGLNKSLKSINYKVEQQNKALTELNATKDTFFRIISHDLKSPLGVIMSFTDLLKDNIHDFNNEEIQSFIRKLHNTSTESFKLLENLLEWSRSQSGTLKYDPVVLDLHELASDNLKLIHNNAREKQIAVRNEIPVGTMVYADRNITSTILRNLLSNALKFTNEGGEVVISIQKQDHMLNVYVSDNGVGMSEEDQRKLFHIENQHHTPGTQNEQGSGIGLILCKELVEKQGGEIGLQSKLGAGSRFYFTLAASGD